MNCARPLDLFFTKPSTTFGFVVESVQRDVFGSSIGVHMGVIVDRTVLDLPQLVPGELYVMESTYYTEYDKFIDVDVVTGTVKNGFQIVRLSDITRSTICSGGKAFIATLTNNPIDDASMREFLRAQVTSFYYKYKDYGYQLNPIYMLSAVFPSFVPIRDKYYCDRNNNMFCSQLVCMLYQRLHIINEWLPNNPEVAPEVILRLPRLFDCFYEIMISSSPRLR